MVDADSLPAPLLGLCVATVAMIVFSLVPQMIADRNNIDHDDDDDNNDNYKNNDNNDDNNKNNNSNYDDDNNDDNKNNDSRLQELGETRD